ncbi:MAG: PKD domain-containing protein [Anaerolineae bacterium]|nr:PKD domain-containing protein [Anaerolineae bacterium]
MKRLLLCLFIPLLLLAIPAHAQTPWSQEWLGAFGSAEIEILPFVSTIGECNASITGGLIEGCTPGTGTGVGVVFRIPFPTCEITRVVVDIAWNRTRGPAGSFENTRIRVGASTVVISAINALGSGTRTLDSGTISLTADEISFDGLVRNNHAEDGSYYRVTRIVLYGTGTNPFTEGNCGAEASFIADPTSGNVPLEVEFTNTSVGTITGYSWDFGDGNTSTAENPTNTYTEPGVYDVELTITGPGGSDVATETITVYDGAGGGLLTRPLAEEDEHPQWGMYDMAYVNSLEDDINSDYPFTVHSFSNIANADIAAVAPGLVIEVSPYNQLDCPVAFQILGSTFHRCTVTIPQVITQETFSYIFVWEMLNVSRVVIQDESDSTRRYTYYLANAKVTVGDEVVAGCIIGETIQLKNPNPIEITSLTLGGALSASGPNVGIDASISLDIRSLLVEAGVSIMWVTEGASIESLYPDLQLQPDGSNCASQTLAACINEDSDLSNLATWALDGGVTPLDGGGVSIPPGAGLHQYDLMIDTEVTYTLNVQARAVAGEDLDADPATLAMMVGNTGEAKELSSSWANYSFTPDPEDIEPDGNITAIHLYNYSQMSGIQVRYVCLVPNTVSVEPGQCYFINHEFDADGTGWIVGSGVTFASGQAYMGELETLMQEVTLLPDDEETPHTYTIRAQVRLIANPSYTGQVGKSVLLEFAYPVGEGYVTLGTIDSALVTTEGLNPYDGTVNVEYPYILSEEFEVSEETTDNFAFRVDVTDGDNYLTGLRIDWFCIEPGGDGTFPGNPGGGFKPPFITMCAVVPLPLDNSVPSWTYYHWKNLERFFKCDLMVLLNKWFNVFYDFQRTTRHVMRWWIALVQYIGRWATSLLWWMDGHFRNMAVGQVTTIYEGGGGPSIWDVLLALVNNIFAPLVGFMGQLVTLFVGIITQVFNLLLTLVVGIVGLVLAFIVQAFGLLALAQQLLIALIGAYGSAAPIAIEGLPSCINDPRSSPLCVGIWVLDNTIFSQEGAIIIPIFVAVLSIHLILWVVTELRRTVMELGQVS